MTFQSYGGGRNGGGWGKNPNEFKDGFDQILKALKGRFYLVGVTILGILVLAGVASSFYTVEPNEEAVIIRLGKYYETTPPGLHFKLPFGIDRVVKVKTKLVLQEEFGFRTRQVRGSRTDYTKKAFQQESHMLTGDLNVADVEWIVQYRISDPKKFLFHARDPIRNIRDISESIMRRVVGDRLVTDVLTTGRVEIASEAQKIMQVVLDKYDMGILIVTVKLQDVNPPDEVKPSFNEVNAAKQEQEKMINQAEKTYNKIIPEARGKAEETISKAEGYATALVNRAKGDAEKFSAVLKAYRTAPDVTRERIYLETMEELFHRFKKLTIVDSKVKGVLPIFSAKNLKKSLEEKSQ